MRACVIQCMLLLLALILENQESCVRGCEEFEYLKVKQIKKDRQENDNNKSRVITAILNLLLWNKQISRKNKLQIYKQK